MITKAFNIEMPNKPYVDNFSDNTVHASEYVGFKYVKVIVDANDWVVNVVSEADSMAELNEQASPVPAGCSAVVIDATANPTLDKYPPVGTIPKKILDKIDLTKLFE